MHHWILSAGIEKKVIGVDLKVILACLRNNMYWNWARITKFSPNKHLGIHGAGIENGGSLTFQGHFIISTQNSK